MLNKFKHYILCKYNYNLYSANPYNIQNKDKWMENRTKLFPKLLNSLKKQTNKNYEFILFVDSKTPESFKQEIKKIVEGNCKDIMYQIYENSIELFFRNLNKNTEFIITSRIDNDDEYTPKFVETIQNSFNNCEEVLDVNGCQFDLSTKKKYTSGRVVVGSPFISLIEKQEKCNGVFQQQHNKMCSKFTCRYVENKDFLYIQNIHDNNVHNKIFGKLIN